MPRPLLIARRPVASDLQPPSRRHQVVREVVHDTHRIREMLLRGVNGYNAKEDRDMTAGPFRWTSCVGSSRPPSVALCVAE